jgi:hypothetical protein
MNKAHFRGRILSVQPSRFPLIPVEKTSQPTSSVITTTSASNASTNATDAEVGTTPAKIDNTPTSDTATAHEDDRPQGQQTQQVQPEQPAKK